MILNVRECSWKAASVKIMSDVKNWPGVTILTFGVIFDPKWPQINLQFLSIWIKLFLFVIEGFLASIAHWFNWNLSLWLVQNLLKYLHHNDFQIGIIYSSTPVCSASVFSNITVWNDSWSDSWFEIFEFGFWLVDESLDHLLLVGSVSVDEDVLFDDKREILLDKLLLFEWKLNNNL